MQKETTIKAIKAFCDPLLKKHAKIIKAIWLLRTEAKEINLIILIDNLTGFAVDRINRKQFELDVLKQEKAVLKKFKIPVHTGFYEMTDYFNKIMENDLAVFAEIKNSVDVYDPTGFFAPLKELVKRGKILGTKESLIRLITSVKARFKNLHDLKLEALDNIYSAVVDAGQAALLAANYSIPIQKDVAKHLKVCFVAKGLLEKRYVDWLDKIVKTFKGFEYGKIKYMTGKEIDDLVDKGKDFIERMDSLIGEIS